MMVGCENYSARFTAIWNSLIHICYTIFRNFDEDQFERTLRWARLLELQAYLCYIRHKVEMEDEFAANIIQIK